LAAVTIVHVDNLLDHHYDTAAQLGPTGFANQGAFIARRALPNGDTYEVQGFASFRSTTAALY